MLKLIGGHHQRPSSSSHKSSISFHPPQNADIIPLHLLSHLGTLAHLEHCPYVPLSDLHTRFWRQQFHGRFKRHSLRRTLIQPSINILYLCFPTVKRSGNASFGFCNTQVLRERVISPPPNPQPGGPGDHSSSGLYPSTCSAWMALPGV